MDILDIGGGFSMSSENPDNNFDVIAPKINDLIKKEFPKNENLRVIAEPGRFISQDALSVVMKIILTRNNSNLTRDYFVDSGVYQALTCQVYDREFFKGHPIVSQTELNNRIAQE